METVIRLEGLTKYYGKQLGIADLNLEVKSGEIFGFLGPNGAGKTTTIRLLLDLLRPTRGTATVLGLDAKADSLEVRRSVGYIPSDPSLYGNLSGHDFLTYLANIRGGVQWSKVTSLADRLQCDLSRPIGALSRGNKQKLAVIRAFMHEPQLLILDEPTSGLDPLMQAEFEDMVREAKNAGRTVCFGANKEPVLNRGLALLLALNWPGSQRMPRRGPDPLPRIPPRHGVPAPIHELTIWEGLVPPPPSQRRPRPRAEGSRLYTCAWRE